MSIEGTFIDKVKKGVNKGLNKGVIFIHKDRGVYLLHYSLPG